MPHQHTRIHQFVLAQALLVVLAAFQAFALALPTSAFGQTDPSNFTTVINVPPDSAPSSIGSSTQLNLGDGGELASEFVIGAGSEVNISGGTVGKYFVAGSGSVVNISGGTVDYQSRALQGSVVNISGGTVGGSFVARSGSVVNMSGGSIAGSFDADSGSVVNINGGTLGPDFDALPGSNVKLIGGEYRLNGTEFTGNSISLTSDDVFTGTLADGSSFIFSSLAAESFEGVMLMATPLPTLDTTPIVVDSSSPMGPMGLRAGQSLTLRDGGTLGENFAVVDATLNFEGGIVGTSLDVAGGVANILEGAIARLFVFLDSEVNISGGSVGDESRAYAGSEVNISGGSVGRRFDANTGSIVNISGGIVGEKFWAYSGSEVNISGGLLGFGFDAFSGSLVNISGGIVSSQFDAFSGSMVNISGGSLGAFATAHSGSVVNMSAGSLGRKFDARSGSDISISGGTIGREFLVRSGSNVELIGGEFRLNGTDFTGTTISLTSGDIFTGTLTDGSVFLFSSMLGDRLIDVTLTDAPLPILDTTPIIVDGSSPLGPSGLRAGQSLTLRDGGALGDDFTAVAATLDIEGGTIGESFEITGSVININGGSVGQDFNANSGTVVNMSGGSIGQRFAATAGSVVNIRGGSFSDNFDVTSGSEMHLFGTQFVLDGVPLDALPFEQAMVISDRNVTLAGLLADGSEFSFSLLSRNGSRNDYFSSDATLTVTLVTAVPEPSSLALVAVGGLALAGLQRRRAQKSGVRPYYLLLLAM